MSANVHRPIIVVHSLAHATCALAAAEDLRVAVTVRSATGAAGYLGATSFGALIREAQRAHPRADVRSVLDCGTAGAFAVEALRRGVKCVRLSVPTELRAKVARIAAQLGAALDTDAAPALDLHDRADPLVDCRRFLELAGTEEADTRP